MKNKNILFGFGENDLPLSSHTKMFDTWYGMIRRCYDKKYQAGKPTYKDVVVCAEWRKVSEFKKWFDKNYTEGYVLDKDILVKGNKVYSPDTCCFVPSEINAAFTKANKSRGALPIGVRLSKSKKKI